VDRDITFADLKGLLTEFCRMTFGPGKPLRFRPSYFRSPSRPPRWTSGASSAADPAAGSARTRGGWRSSAREWSTPPFRLRRYDPEEYTGFAFGMGVERIAMLRHGISDIRLFFENDIRFLSQF